MGSGDGEEEWAGLSRPGPHWRNPIGDFWRRGERFYVEELDYGVVVSKWNKSGQECIWRVRFRHEHFDWSHPSGVDHMASQWISRAISKKEPQARAMPSSDNTIYKDRPALTEFMTLIVDDEGNAREPSVLMICATANGFRVGLKDDDAGGWLWREEETFQKALNSIEKALQSGNVSWAIPGGKGGKRR